MEAIPIALFWGLALLGLSGKSHVLLYLFFGTMPFGAFAVIPPALTGGLTLTPTPMLALLIIIRSLCSWGGLKFFAAAAYSRKRLLLLFLFWLVAIVTTIFMPRFFAGEVSIIPVRLEQLVVATTGEPLKPTTQNFSQLAYLTISIFAVFAFARMLRDPVQRQHALSAMYLGAALTVFTGLLDFLSQYVALDGLLSPFRTATYALMTEAQTLGGKRVVGLMPEASAYGGLCISFLCLIYFLRHAMTDRWLRERASPALAALLVLFIWLSTSSGAYVGLAVFGLIAAMEWAWRKNSKSADTFARRRLGFEFWTAFSALLGLSLVLLVNPSLLDPIVEKIDEMVLSKSQTRSYEERSMWTAVGWQALADTWGLGVGIGSTRTSNFAAAVFSNTGVIGGLLYFAFVLQTLLSRLPSSADGVSRAMLRGVHLAYIPAFIIGLLAGTTADFGSYNAFLYGVSLALTISAAKQGHRPVENPGSATAIAPPFNLRYRLQK
ncbi:hypothetical protein ACFSKY_03175 [Azotobacter chroococcum]|uniref:O-antigen ligase domain-containing protein n=1 Tax=Azotobacter chroococcum TaxID=353 RepID=A0A4R1PSH9_9GAMM|nr:hypothetical protein [Azotobacter chroococcum]TCL34685.1 hypothetical protein EV691_101120 [Azotobacter chroococcum]